MLQKKYLTGFTLIELLLALTIVALITSMSYYFLGTSKKENDLRTAEREVAATIKLAQSYALQGKYVPTAGGTPCGFGFHFKDDKKTYEIFYIPSEAGNKCEEKNTNNTYRQFIDDSSSPRFERFELKNNITLQNTIDESEIYFTVPHGNTFDNSGSTYPGRVLNLQGPGAATKEIAISSSGSVSEE